jgi:hypothetical protein
MKLLQVGRGKIVAGLAFIIAILALWAALAGVVNESIYGALDASTPEQDFVSIPLAFILLAASLYFLKNQGYKIFIIILGLTGYFLS